MFIYRIMILSFLWLLFVMSAFIWKQRWGSLRVSFVCVFPSKGLHPTDVLHGDACCCCSCCPAEGAIAPFHTLQQFRHTFLSPLLLLVHFPLSDLMFTMHLAHINVHFKAAFTFLNTNELPWCRYHHKSRLCAQPEPLRGEINVDKFPNEWVSLSLSCPLL